MRVVVFSTSTESVSEVLVVFVGFRGLLSRYVALLAGLRVQPERAWRCFWHTSSTAIAYEVALVEQFNEGMFSVARDGTRVAYCCGRIAVGGSRRRQIAGQTGIQALTQGTEVARACIELLRAVSWSCGNEFGMC